MKMQVTATTDDKFIGHEFDSNDNPIVLADDMRVSVERVMPLPDGVRFINSCYVIDAKEVA